MRLRYTPEALAELDQVVNDLSEHSLQGARNVLARVQSLIATLADYPYSGKLTSLRPMRRVVATPYPYLVFYEPAGDEIIVIAIRHAARDPSSMPDRP